MLVKWRTSLRTFLSEVEDEDGVEAEQTNEDISNRVRIYKRASADYEAQHVDRWSCRLCSIINEVPIARRPPGVLARQPVTYSCVSCAVSGSAKHVSSVRQATAQLDSAHDRG